MEGLACLQLAHTLANAVARAHAEWHICTRREVCGRSLYCARFQSTWQLGAYTHIERSEPPHMRLATCIDLHFRCLSVKESLWHRRDHALYCARFQPTWQLGPCSDEAVGQDSA